MRTGILRDVTEDLRYVSRRSARRILSEIVLTVVFAVGIGLAAAVFGIVDGIIIKPLPYRDAEQLISIHGAAEPPDRDVARYWGQAKTLSNVARYSVQDTTLVRRGESESVVVCVTSDTIFDVLGVTPSIGRGFATGNEAAREYVAVISYQSYTKRFNKSPGVVGSTLVIGGVPHIIVGVMGAAFRFVGNPEFYVCERPHMASPRYGSIARNGTGAAAAAMVGRMKSGVNQSAARRELDGMRKELNRKYGGVDGVNYGEVLYVQSWKSLLTLRAEPVLVILSICALLLLATAGTYVYSVMMCRIAADARVFAIHQCHGATYIDLFRMVLLHVSFITLPACIVGVMTSSLIRRGILVVLGQNLPSYGMVPVNMRVVLFALLVCCGMSVIITAATLTYISRQGPWKLLLVEEGGFTNAVSGRRMLGGIGMFQVTLSTFLMAMGVSSWMILREMDRRQCGFEPAGVAVAELRLPADKRQDTARGAVVYDQLEEWCAESINGGMGFTNMLPFAGSRGSYVFCVSGNVRKSALAMTVGGDYFSVMGIQRVAGRLFRDCTVEELATSVVVNKRLAATLWGTSLHIGKELLLEGEKHPRRVIGVVQDVVVSSFGVNEPQVYVDHRGSYRGNRPSDGPTLVFRRNTPFAAASVLKGRLKEIDPEILVYRSSRMDDVVAEANRPIRALVGLSMIEALGAMTIATLGVYGIMSYRMESRRREIGIRAALGATAPMMMLNVISEGMLFGIVGTGSGLLLFYWASRAFPAFVSDMVLRSASMLFGTVVVMIAATIVGSLVPAVSAGVASPLTSIKRR